LLRQPGTPSILKSALIFSLVLSMPLAAADAKKAVSKSKVPPILDRELFFGNPELAGAQLSPDGKYIAFLKPWNGTRNIWVKRTGEPYSTAHLVSADPKRPVPTFFWSRDGKYILFVQDKDGDENYNVYAVDPSAKPEAGKDAPPARNITEAKGVRAEIFGTPKTDPDTIFVGLNDRDAAWHDLYKVKISTGERTLLRKNTERITAWIFDNQGQLRLAMRTTDSGNSELLRVDAEGFTKIYETSIFESAEPAQFHKDGKRIYLQTNKGNRDLTQLVLLDPETGKEELVESDPQKHVDFGGAIFSEVTDELLATVYQDDRQRIYFKDKALEADYKLLQKKLPGREISLVSSTKDEQLFLIRSHSDTDPGTCYLFDRKTKQLSPEYTIREKLPRADMAPMKSIHYKSSDGLDIPAYLTLPKGKAAKNLPLVVVPHGGPWARDGWGFNNLAQFLANRGYAVLQPNFRSSTGYGKKFLNAGNKQWGERMQDDLTWGVNYLTSTGIADPKHVGIMGGSYGGYATLAGVAFTPNLYQAAISIVGPSNLLTLLETIPPYWEAGRVIFHERMGNPATPEGKKQLERQSPLFSADKIKTPLMVIQGANDPRVKKTESEQIVIALRDRNFPVEYVCAPDEGHGFARPVNNMAMFATSERFLAKFLGGRFQEGGTPEVVTRLKEITVDPKTVVLTKKVDTAAALPTIAVKPTAGLYKYAGTLSLQGQNMPLTSTTEVKEEGDALIVNAAFKLPMMEGSDRATYAKDTFVPRSRSTQQGPVTIELTYEGTKAKGTLAMNGQNREMNVDLGGQAFGDGAGQDLALASLDLKEGFSVTFRVLDAEKQKGALKQAKVTASESITVPAGTFKTWKVEVASAEGEPGAQTLWIDSVTRKIVKITQTIPQMGGAVIAAELQ